MKILVVTPLFPTAQRPVAGLFVKEQCEALRKRGHDVQVIVLDACIPTPLRIVPQYARSRPVFSQSTQGWVCSAKLCVFPGYINLVGNAIHAQKKVLQAYKDNFPKWIPDIVHAHTILPGALCSETVAKQCAVPLVATSHGIDTRVHIKHPRRLSAIQKLSKNVSTVICVGHGIADELQRVGIAHDKTAVIHNGVDPEKIHNPASNNLDNKRKNTTILGVGNLVPCKGFEHLVEAIRMLTSKYSTIQCVIIGEGKRRKVLEKLIQQHKLEEVVKLKGRLSHDETMIHMSNCDIFCLPSWSEGFGIVYLEAMAHGKPVVAVEDQGIAPVVTSSQGGLLVKPHSANAVATALQKLLDNPVMAKQMGQLGKTAVLSKWTLDQQVDQLVEAYSIASRSTSA